MTKSDEETQLSQEQTARLIDSLVQHMLGDRGYLWYVAEIYASSWSLADYHEWFQEDENGNLLED